MISGDFGRSAPPSWLASAKPLRLASSALALLPRDRSCRRRSHDAGPVAGGPSTQQPTSPTTRRLSVPAAIRTTCAVCTSTSPYTNTTARRAVACARLPAASPTTRHPRTRHAARRVAAHAASAVACEAESGERAEGPPPRAPCAVARAGLGSLASRGVSLARFGHRSQDSGVLATCVHS